MSPPAEPDLNADAILLGLNNGPGIYIAPAGTAPPAVTAGDSTDWITPWEPLGYLSDDGVTLGSSTTSDTLTPWQSTSPVRTVITGKELTLHFIMWQTGPAQMALWFDITKPTESGGGGVSFDVRSDAGGELYAVGIDILDQDVVTRITFGRANLSDTGDVTFARGSAIAWEVTLAALDNNGVLGHVDSLPAPAGALTARAAPERQPAA